MRDCAGSTYHLHPSLLPVQLQHLQQIWAALWKLKSEQLDRLFSLFQPVHLDKIAASLYSSSLSDELRVNWIVCLLSCRCNMPLHKFHMEPRYKTIIMTFKPTSKHHWNISCQWEKEMLVIHMIMPHTIIFTCRSVSMLSQLPSCTKWLQHQLHSETESCCDRSCCQKIGKKCEYCSRGGVEAEHGSADWLHSSV